MRTYGLIGYPLTHSFSPGYFAAKFQRENITDAEYKIFPLADLSELAPLLRNHPDLLGLNVTIPYKEAVVPYAAETDEIVRETGAANTLVIQRKNDRIWLKAFNTDVTGFRLSLETMLRTHHHQALILGTGGSSKAVEYVLKKTGIATTFVSREKKSGALTYGELDAAVMQEHTLIVNTTPLGMFPAVDSFPPIPYEHLSFTHLLYDLVYNPHETLFLKKGKAQGAAVKNGLEMLEIQAEESWKIWNSFSSGE